jgi:hypothetical protein
VRHFQSNETDMLYLTGRPGVHKAKYSKLQSLGGTKRRLRKEGFGTKGQPHNNGGVCRVCCAAIHVR